MEKYYYLKVGRASELENQVDRAIYRFFEIIPGVLSWGGLFLAVFLAWFKPFWVAIFIICFAIFWFLRSVYFSFHLWSGYRKMKENEKRNWIRELDNLSSFEIFLPTVNNWKDIYHLIVVPMYKESYEIVRDNFKSLVASDYPKEKMIVVLACEEAAKEQTIKTAQRIEREFSSSFFRFLVSWHPSKIPGEISGKGSNETWAAKKSKELIIDSLNIDYKNIIFSSFDVDTCVFSKYFACLTYYYLTSKNPTKNSFQPIPLYINNIWQAPIISRLFSFSATFWYTMCQERPEKMITFSSHSMSFYTLVDVGFKQTNIVQDDSRIFWQCFLQYDGNYKTQPLYYPISMDANVSKNFFKTMLNIYKQQRRWAYGVGDIPYFLFGFLKNRKISLIKKISLSFEIIEGHFSWATASILILLLGWLPLVLGGAEFSQTMISYNLPRIISIIMAMAMIGLISSIYLSSLLLPPKPPDYGKFKYIISLFGWVLLPLIMIFFTSFPALDAQTRWMFGKYMGFWVTEKIRK